MILQSLTNYYDRLSADPEHDVAEFGFDREKISFCVVLNPDGTPEQIKDVRETVEFGGKTKRTKQSPTRMVVPARGGRSGTMLKANFLWDNTGYALGCDGRGKPERSRDMFEAFRTLHKEFLEKVDDPGLVALCRFLDDWELEGAHERVAELAGIDWEELCDANLVFRLVGNNAYLHDSKPLCDAWFAFVGQEFESQPGYCLVTGKEDRLARLHPMIRGIAGAQSSGAALASFNLDAFTSYGKEQSYNAPVGIRSAFRYTTALNRLIGDESHRIRFAGSTVVFWTDKPSAFEGMFGSMLDTQKSEDEALVKRIRGFWDNLRCGKIDDELDDPDVGFHVLGISPNAARLSVRFWLTGTVKDFVERLGHHAKNLNLGKATTESSSENSKPKGMVYQHIFDRPLSIRRILDQTARERKEIHPLLEGSLLRAILSNGPYPSALCSSLLKRISVEGEINDTRAAILKAITIRNWSIPMETYLNKRHKEKAYHCGRLLAVLAFAQERALGEINSGVIRRNLGSVMAAPALMLGRLEKAAEVGHISKLAKKLRTKKLAEFIRDELTAINVTLQDEVPKYLDLRLQTVFALGFYQQLQYMNFVESQVSGNTRHRTSQGEWVRSKLEVSVADTLSKLGIPYVYELSAILPDCGERWPDFFVGGSTPKDDLYIEVLGMDTPEYNARWEQKLAGFEAFGAPETGGPNGRLIILDFRGEDKQFDETKVFNGLRGHIPHLENLDTTLDEGENDE